MLGAAIGWCRSVLNDQKDLPFDRSLEVLEGRNCGEWAQGRCQGRWDGKKAPGKWLSTFDYLPSPWLTILPSHFC